MSLSTDVNFNFGEGRGGCPVGSQGEFATFGFLSFITTMFSTIINMGQCIHFNSVIDLRYFYSDKYDINHGTKYFYSL